MKTKKWLSVILMALRLEAVQEVSSLENLKRSLEEADQDWPTMAAVLIYEAGVDLKKMRRTLERASRNHHYHRYVDFLEIEVSSWSQADQTGLQSLVLLDTLPKLVLFFNGKKIAQLSGGQLEQAREVVSFVRDNFAGDILKIKRKQEAKVERIVRYDDRPRLYWGASFGAPFYANRYGWPRYGYYYPYDYGFYFGW